MYQADQGQTLIVDRREMLRVKIKSLAVEAQIIRKEERRIGGQLREELYRHRIDIVRYEARHAHLAYGFIRGLSYEQMEPSCAVSPNWDKVRQNLKKFGPRDFVEPTVMSKPVKVKEYGPRTPRIRPNKEAVAA